MTDRPDTKGILDRGRDILGEEGQAILAKREALGKPFVTLVNRLLGLRGKVGVTGVGKSGIIGEKIAMTLSSTGTPALFLKPVDALHGDLGVLRADDYLLAISNSGETTEVLAVVDAARSLDIPVSALTGNVESSLARRSEVSIDIGVRGEACSLGLAPTTSTTVTLAVGDALALVLSEQRGFTAEHYAGFHPGGALGQRLRHRVRDFMRPVEQSPVVDEETSLRDAIREMTERDNLGVTLVVDRSGALSGIITDGDLRRLLVSTDGAAGKLSAPARELMTRSPQVIEPETPASEALRIMELRSITSLAVVDHRSHPLGLVHLHDILGRGKVLL